MTGRQRTSESSWPPTQAVPPNRWLDAFRRHHDDDVEVSLALDRLLGAGCEPLNLAWLLLGLSSGQLKRARAGEIRALIQKLEEVAARTRDLFYTELLLDDDAGNARALVEGNASHLAASLRKILPTIDGRRQDYTNTVLRRLATYVNKATGKPYEQEVTTLINAAARKGPDERQIAPRRRRDRLGGAG